jgi:hypothetical protein
LSTASAPVISFAPVFIVITCLLLMKEHAGVQQLSQPLCLWTFSAG